METQDALGGDHTLHVDRFGLSIGRVSVGLPMACTSDDVYRRYLDLRRILRQGPVDVAGAPSTDLQALAEATSNDAAYVARRLMALQASSGGSATP